jgi:glycosyltransferase involved in cell wall biosynthesis
VKIATVFSSGVTNVNYRAVLPQREMERRGHDGVTVMVDANGRFPASQLADRDVIHVYRWAGRPLMKVLDDLRNRGAAIVWDNDDDPRLIPAESPSFKQYGSFNGAQDFRKQITMMGRAHVVTTTTRTLAERYEAVFDGEIEVIENYLCDEQFSRDARQHDGIVIGWVAALEHQADSQRLQIAKVLRSVMEQAPKVRVVTIGVRLDLDPARYSHREFVPFPELPGHVRQFDIGIAPLSDIPMSAARSNVKLKEYAAAGVPWLASRRAPDLGLGERQGGMLVDDDAWEDALLKLVGARLKRRQLRRNAESWAKSQHLSRHVHRWEAVYDAALSRVGRSAA